jgi:hypothetical protein
MTENLITCSPPLGACIGGVAPQPAAAAIPPTSTTPRMYYDLTSHAPGQRGIAGHLRSEHITAAQTRDAQCVCDRVAP